MEQKSMFKRILSFVVIFTMLFSSFVILAAPAFAADEVVDSGKYGAGLTIEVSDNDEIVNLSAEEAAKKLTDGDWALDAPAWGGDTSGVVLIKNKNATQANAYGQINLIWNLGDDPEAYNQIRLGLYSSVESMIGYPTEEDVFFSNDGESWVGGYSSDDIGYGETIPTAYATFEEGATAPGTVIGEIKLRNPQTYKYVKIELYFPKSPFTVESGKYTEETAKPRWEFFGLTEIEITSVKTSNVVTDWNPHEYWEGRGGSNGSYAFNNAEDYAASNLVWWKHVSFAPVEGEEGKYTIAGIRNAGENPKLDFPEGGFVWAAWGDAGAGTPGKAALNLFSSMSVGDVYVLTGFDVEGEYVENDATVTKYVDPNAPVNVALGSKYEIVGLAPSGDYPDTDNKELTDGARVNGKYGEPGWVGVILTSTVRAFDVVVTLGDGETVYNIDKIIVNAGAKGATCGVTEPNLKSFYSIDGEEWTEFGTYTATDNADVMSVNATMEVATPVAAKYIKVNVTRPKEIGNLMWLGEIEAYGKEAEAEPAFEYPEGYTVVTGETGKWQSDEGDFDFGYKYEVVGNNLVVDVIINDELVKAAADASSGNGVATNVRLWVNYGNAKWDRLYDGYFKGDEIALFSKDAAGTTGTEGTIAFADNVITFTLPLEELAGGNEQFQFTICVSNTDAEGKNNACLYAFCDTFAWSAWDAENTHTIVLPKEEYFWKEGEYELDDTGNWNPYFAWGYVFEIDSVNSTSGACTAIFDNATDYAAKGPGKWTTQLLLAPVEGEEGVYELIKAYKTTGKNAQGNLDAGNIDFEGGKIVLSVQDSGTRPEKNDDGTLKFPNWEDRAASWGLMNTIGAKLTLDGNTLTVEDKPAEGTKENPAVIEILPGMRGYMGEGLASLTGGAEYYWTTTVPVDGNLNVQFYVIDAEYNGYSVDYSFNGGELLNNYNFDNPGLDDLKAGDVVTLYIKVAADAPAVDVTAMVSLDAVGSMSNPEEITEAGDVTTEIAEGNFSGHTYEFVAPADGKVTVTMSEDNTGWFYAVSVVESGVYGENHYSDDDTVVASETVEVKEGDVVTISVSTYGGMSTEGTVKWTLAFEEVVPVTSKVVTDFNPTSYKESFGGATGAFVYDDADIYASAGIDWWIHVMFVPSTEFEGVYEVVGVRAPQTGNYLTLAEGAFIWAAWSSAGDTPESSGAYALGFMNKLSVGDLVKFTGVDFANHITTEDAIAEVFVDPNAPVNVALNKEYTISGIGNRDSYYGSITDGSAVMNLNGDNNKNWFGFYNNGDAPTNAPDKVGYFIIDLEKVYDVDTVKVGLVQQTDWGIAGPAAVKAYGSLDGETFEEIGTFEFSLVNGVGIWTEIATEAKAQYIKIEVALAGTFAFVNEVEVYGEEAEGEPVEKDITVVPNYNFKYAAGNTTILVPWTMGDTLESILDKQYEWFNFAILEWDADAAVYKVVDVKIGTDIKASVDPENGVDFGVLEIPEYGFILGAHNDDTANHEAIAKLEAGDIVYIYGTDLINATIETALTDAVVTTKALDDKTAFAPEIKTEEPVISGWGAGVEVMTDGYNGLGEITGYEGNNDKIYGFGNNLLVKAEYDFTVALDAKHINAITLYALDYANGGVMLPESVKFVVNGKSYDAVITPNENGIATIKAELGEVVSATEIKVEVVMGESPYTFGIFNMFTEIEVTEAKANITQWAAGADIDVLTDGYNGLGEITGYENNGDKLYGLGNDVLFAAPYSFTVTIDEATINAITLYALDYAGGGVMLPESVKFVVNGKSYDAVITPNENGIATIKAELGEDVTVTEITVEAVMGDSPYTFGIFNMFTELEVTEAVVDPTVGIGDVNGNGEIEMYDYILVKRQIMNTIELTDEQKAVADVNGNGEIEMYDYILIKRHIMGTYVIGE